MAVGPRASHLSLPCGLRHRPIQVRSSLNSLYYICLLPPSNPCTTHPVPRLIPALLQLKPPTLPGTLQERAKFPSWLPDSLVWFLSRVSPAMQVFFNSCVALGLSPTPTPNLSFLCQEIDISVIRIPIILLVRSITTTFK